MRNNRIIGLLAAIVVTLSASAQTAVKEEVADTSSLCRVALIQPHLVWGEVKANLSAFEKRVEQCQACDLIVLPELFTSGCDMKKKTPEEGMCAKDEVAAYYPIVIEKMQQWAKQADALLIGSTIYKEEGKYYNRLLAVFPDGSYQYYDKHNCFKKGAFSPGNKQLTINWRGRRYATYICYDLRFPQWSRNLGQYDAAIYIANWPASRRTDWNELLQQRAIENKAHVIAVNCAGTDLAGIDYAGESCLIDPTGQILAKSEDYKDDCVICFF